jgi:carbamoyl-phosphate synthase large subunit
MKTVAVSALHRGENPQPGAAVIASLRRSFKDIRIAGMSYDPLESGLYGNGHDKPDSSYLMPYPGMGTEVILKRIDEILQHEKLDVIIPCLDSEIDNYINMEPELKKRGITCVLPTKESLKYRAKSNLPELCSKTNVLTPKTKVIYNLFELELYADSIVYPVYVKGKYYEAHLVYYKGELLEVSTSITRVWGWPILIQEAIIGEEYGVAGIGDGKGNIIMECCIRKMLRSTSGKGFAGIVIENFELDEFTKRIIAELKWNGPFELEFIKTPGKPMMLFEINPRFPAWIDFPSQVDFNMPARLLEQLLGIKNTTPINSIHAGQIFIRHAIDIVGNIEDFARISRTGNTI